jgi:flagellar biosynthesis/type III secretory pathway protein FliH
MSLYRLVARDRLNEAEVRPFRQSDLVTDGLAVRVDQGERETYRTVELESLDLLKLGPYLLLLAAEEKAGGILAEAKIEAEKIRSEAAEQGAAQGREASKQDLLPCVTAFANAGQALIVFEEKMVSAYTPQLVRLALAIAEKMVGRALDEDPKIIASVLERAGREVVNAKQIRIWLHPADHQALAEICPQLVACGGEQGRKIEVIASAEVGRGGCRLETEIGVVDATMPTQLEEIHRQLLDEEP